MTGTPPLNFIAIDVFESSSKARRGYMPDQNSVSPFSRFYRVSRFSRREKWRRWVGFDIVLLVSWRVWWWEIGVYSFEDKSREMCSLCCCSFFVLNYIDYISISLKYNSCLKYPIAILIYSTQSIFISVYYITTYTFIAPLPLEHTSVTTNLHLTNSI